MFSNMGFFTKEEKWRKQLLRGVKTVLFLITMLVSLILFSAPVFLLIADTLLPSALLSAAVSPASLSLETLYAHLTNYDFRYSLPLISIFRSSVIVCVYSLCHGPRLSRRPYLAITAVCSVSSLVFVSLKAPFVFTGPVLERGGYVRAVVMSLFISSFLLAVAHIIVAYKISCRERRKLVVYKIDIEAVNSQPWVKDYSFTQVLIFHVLHPCDIGAVLCIILCIYDCFNAEDQHQPKLLRQFRTQAVDPLKDIF